MNLRPVILGALLILVGCSGLPGGSTPAPSISDARTASDAPADGMPPPDAAPRPVEWLRGSTHVHALPSGDSKVPVVDVMQWYDSHGYDFIVLTDHNRVSEVDGNTAGKPWVSWPGEHGGPDGLIVLAGIELTYNPPTCDPAPPLPDGKCRIHLNALGVTARPEGKVDWPARKSELRADQFAAAGAAANELGGLLQLNHPQWHWGMSPELLLQAASDGVLLMEIANRQFEVWNAGIDQGKEKFPSTESLWDAALAAGATIWGVASDDAHHYFADGSGQYPAGKNYIVVHAKREPAAIRAAMAAGEFYASTGVDLARVEVLAGALIVEVADTSPGVHVIRFIENGVEVGRLTGRVAARAIPPTGTLRVVVDRADGAKAWVQPVRTTLAAE